MRAVGRKEALQESVKYLMELRRLDIRFAGFSQMPKAIHRSGEALGTGILEILASFVAPSIARLEVGAVKYQAIVVLHEK
jgi:hypothetical protein